MTDAADRLPPQDNDAEQATLGAMLEDAAAKEKALAILRPEDFYGTTHRRVFAAVAFLHGRGEPCDALSVSQALADLGTLDECGGFPYMLALVEAGTPWQVERQAQRVRDKATLRGMISAAEQIGAAARNGGHGVAEVLAESKALFDALQDRAGANDGKDWAMLLADFLDQKLPEASWFLDRYIPVDGLTFVAGDPKSLKSMFCWTLGICCASGADFLGQIAVPIQGPVLIIDEESGASRLQERLRRMAAEAQAAGAPIYLRLNKHWRLHRSQDLAQLAGFVKDRSIRFVLIDSLDAVAQGAERGFDIFRPDSARALSQPLLDIAHDHSLTIVAIHHLRKPGVMADKAIHRLLGSMDLTAAADSVIGIERVGDSESRRVMSIASRWESAERCPDFTIGVQDTESGGLTLTWGDFCGSKERPRTQADRVDEVVRAALASGEWLTTAELVASAAVGGGKERTVKDRLKRLLADGILEHKGGKGGAWYRDRGAAEMAGNGQPELPDDDVVGPFQEE